jgi:peptidoglycan/xylan/chitin deacetylase (PgdA/CDA1 family)
MLKGAGHVTTRDRRTSYSDGDYYGENPRTGRSSASGGASPYGSQDSRRSYTPSGNRTSPYAGARGTGSSQQPTAYPVGAGRSYTSTRPTHLENGGARGVRPVASGSRATGGRGGSTSPYGGGTGGRGGSGDRDIDLGTLGRRPIDRRALIVAGCGVVAAAVAGFAGCSWFTHRAVACTVNGSMRKVPIGSSADDIVALGFASPSAGDLLSIETPEHPSAVVEGGVGQGNPYTLVVNGVEVDRETWRLREGDDVTFVDGEDLIEPVTTVNTPVPCSIQLTDGLLAAIGYVAQWGRDGVSTVETGTISGYTVDRGVTQEPQDLIIAKAGVNPDDGRKLVAITFDDGPDLTYTPQYLDILAQYNAKATFFNIGTSLENGDAYVEMCRRVAQAGHQVASHTYSHNNDTLPLLDAETRDYEVSRGFELVSNASGVETAVVRPPYGEYYATDFLQYLTTGGSIAYTAYWTIDSDDWSVATSSGLEDGAAQIVSTCTSALYAGYDCNGAIILMHDGGGDRSRDVLALPQILQAYTAAGYQFVTLNEMIAADSSFPSWVSSGLGERPEGTVIPDTTGFL